MLSSVQTIVVPTDFSPFSDVAVRSAAAIGLRDAAAIHLLHVIRLPFFHTTYDLNVPETIWQSLRTGAQDRMDETQRALRSCSVPVLAVKGHGLAETPLRRILVASDFSSHASLALSIAISLARRSDARLEIVHVLDESPDYVRYLSLDVARFESQARLIADERLEELRARVSGLNLPVATHLGKGVPGEILAAEADRLGADLIVMGTHGHTGFTHMTLGSVAETTLRLAPCSVLTIRTDSEDRVGASSG